MTNVKSAAGAIALAGVLASAAHAAIEGPQSQSQSQPQGTPSEQRGMMGMHSMMKMMGQMDSAQMKQMMDNCNKLMGAATPSQTPGTPQQPRS